MGWKFPGYLVRGESWLTEGGRKIGKLCVYSKYQEAKTI